MDQSFVELAKLIGNYGVGVVCLAVLIGLHVYNVRVTLPSLTEAARKDLMGMLSSFKEELEKERTSSSAIIQSLAQSFKEELKEERNQCREDHEKMMGVLQEHRLILANLKEHQDLSLRTVPPRRGGA